MRFLFLARVLFALLAFQLAVGLQVGVAHAASMHVPAHASVTAASGTRTPTDACPMHTSTSHAVTSQDRAPQVASVPDTPHAKVPVGTPAGKHDCCKSSGCQGQCGNALLAFNVSLTRNSPASTRVHPISTERAVVAPADTHFRPPILS